MTVWWSRAILTLAVAALVALPTGALGTRFGLWDFRLGLTILMGAAFVAALVFLAGLVSWFLANGRGLAGDRNAISIGLLFSAGTLALMAMQFAAATSVPRIHNISTDVNDPPTFDKVLSLRGQDSNSLAYDAEVLAPQQQAAYPGVKTLALGVGPTEALEQAAAALAAMGLDVVNKDPVAGRVEAVATSFWFGFKDDVVVRVRPAGGGGSQIDVRSVSRVGESDLGANAKRIGLLLARLEP